MAVYTIRKILEEHPEWADLPITIYKDDGSVDYVGDEYEKGGIRLSEDGNLYDDEGNSIEGSGTPVLVIWS